MAVTYEFIDDGSSFVIKYKGQSYRAGKNDIELLIPNQTNDNILEIRSNSAQLTDIEVNLDEDTILGVGAGSTTASDLDAALSAIFFLDESGISPEALANASSGIEFTGGFAGKPLSNSYVWEPGVGINITQDDVNDGIFKTFSLDSSVQSAVDTPYWTDPTPSDHTDKGVFGGSYLPSGVDKVFDYTSVDSDTYEDGTNIATTGGFDFSQLSVGDKVEIRFDFNAIPQVANTTIEPAVWYKNRDNSNNVTFTFPLTAQPIFYGTGTVGKTYLNRVNISIYIASQEDINSLSHLAIKSDNRIIIQPLSVLFTLVR
jgi:hypothetical protein